MEALKQILIAHARRYRLMEPVDAVKLIYQNEFGGGHLIRDEAQCIRYLHQEYEAVQKNAAAERCEDIGNGLVRVHLAALLPEQLQQLGEDFIRSAARHTGSMERFLQKLELLRQVTREGHFSFGPAQLEEYLRAYAQAGYPMVSHSEAYRRAYQPAYRIVLGKEK